MLRPIAVIVIAALYPFAATATEGPLATTRDDADLSRCMPSVELDVYLDRAWSEQPVIRAESANGNASALYASRRGSWTLVETRADGMACIEASGKRLHRLDQAGRDGPHRS